MKKVVHYEKDSLFFEPVVGLHAYLRPIDHPDSDRVSNKKYVETSAVVAVNGDGVFETENTEYRPQ